MSAQTKKYDALIVGGGPGGASAAIHLAASGAHVLLAERESFPRAKLCGEFVSPECRPHLTRLGVLDGMTQAGATQVAETIFYAPSGRHINVPSAWFGGEHGGACALGISRAEMDARLLARAREVGVEVVEEAQAVGVWRDGESVRGVCLSVGGRERRCAARVTVDATGRARAVARLFERAAPSLADDERSPQTFYATKRRAPLVAFKAHLEKTRGAEGVCEIYFYRGGYGGLSPVEGGASNLCFIARAEDVRACGSDAERVMREVVMKNSRAARTLERARARDRWLAVALESFGRAEPSPAPGLLSVGDAASFIDPFTGSGMLMALESGELAAHSIRRLLSANQGAETEALGVLAREYAERFEERFGARLALCDRLRRAAFAPVVLVEAATFALGASRGLRRRLARATRGGDGRRGAVVPTSIHEI